jgi:hypothetical protein
MSRPAIEDLRAKELDGLREQALRLNDDRYGALMEDGGCPDLWSEYQRSIREARLVVTMRRIVEELER